MIFKNKKKDDGKVLKNEIATSPSCNELVLEVK